MVNLTKIPFTSILIILTILPIFNAQSSQGFTVSSVSLTNVLHPGQALAYGQPPSQAQWKITTVFNGGGQSLVANLGNSTINYQDSKGRLITSGYPVQISGHTNPETAFYVINNANQNRIYTMSSQIQLGSVTESFLYSNAIAAPACLTNQLYGEWDFYVTVYPNFNQPIQVPAAKICIYSQLIGTETVLPSTPNIQFSSQLSLLANGQQENLNLNYNTTSAISPDGLVQAQWVGSLVTGTAPPDGSQYVAISNPQTNQWNLQSLNNYNTWFTEYSSHLQNKIPNQIISYNPTSITTLSQSCTGIFPLIVNSQFTNASLYNVANCMNIVAQNDYSLNNQYANQLLSAQTTINGNPISSTNYNGNQAFSISLGSTFTTNPEIILTMSGSFIGVVIPVGKPKILSVTSTPFTSGNNGTIKVQVQNTGGAPGSFTYSLSNCNGISPVSPTPISVAVGQNQEIDVPIFTSGVNQTVNQQCTITITDYNGGGSDSAQVNIVSRPANQCTPNTQIVQGSSICPCVNVSGVYKVATGSSCISCSYGVLGDGKGGFLCSPPPSTTVVSQTTTISSQPTTSISYNKLGHEDIVIVTIGSKLNEDSTYKTALVNYQNLLTSRGLNYAYIELDTYDKNLNLSNWQSIKTDINKIEYQTTPTYLIILGGVNIIPMPTVNTKISFSAAGLDFSNPNTIFTDDPYGSLTNSNIPSIVVSRFPGSSADEIATFLSNDLKKHITGNYKTMIVGVGLNDSHNGFIKYDTNFFSTTTTNLACQQNNNCFYAPSYCLGLLCNASSAFQNYIANIYGVQYYNCHGDGFSCVDYWGTYPVIESTLLDGASISTLPQLNTNPIIIIGACYDGAVDGSYLLPLPLVKPLALTALDNGASVYIGNTKEGYGYYTPHEEAAIYNKFNAGETIGKAFLDMKIKYLTNPNDDYQLGTAHELQLYGDPTITTSG